MTEWFGDTFFFAALINPADRAHERAVEAATFHDGSIVTTAWVITELADACAPELKRRQFIKFLASIRADPAFKIVPSTPDLFERGLELYHARPDKAWSLTDCISFTVMHDRGLTDALTGDHHFEQAGFRALLLA